MRKVIKNFFSTHFGDAAGHRFLVAFLGSLATVLAFDVLWCMVTGYRALGFATTYIYALGVAWIMAFPAALWRSRWVMLPVLLVADLLALANLMYCRTYFGPIPASSYLLADNVADFGDAIIHSLRWYDVIFVIITAVTLWQMKRAGRPTRSLLKGWLIGILAVTVISSAYALIKRTPFSDIDRLKSMAYFYSTPPVAYTLPVSIAHGIVQNSSRPSDEAVESACSLAARLDSLKAANHEPTDTSGSAVRNIVFIVVESLEAWPLEASVEGQEITPRLNRLLADSASVWYGRRVLSQVGAGRSIDGQLLMTAGMIPTADEVFSMKYPDNAYPHLLQALKRHNGAKSYLLSGDRATTWNEGYLSMAFGMDERYFREEWDCSEHFGNSHNPSDGSIVPQIIERMKSGEIWPEGEAAFVEFLTYSSHYPFVIPEDKCGIKLSAGYPGCLGDYIRVINYVDNAVGTFVDYIRSRSDSGSTMIVIAGDHEALAAYRSDIRGAGAEYASLVDADSFVPLIIINPAVAGRRDAVMGQVDVYPTVLSQAGLSGDASFGGFGFSALSPLSPTYAIDRSGYLAGDTSGADSRVFELVRAMPAVSSTFIKADMIDKKR